MGSIGKPRAHVIQLARPPGWANNLSSALPALYFTVCRFICEKHGGTCLEKFLMSLGKWLFARLHKAGEALGFPYVLWVVRARRGKGGEWQRLSFLGGDASLEFLSKGLGSIRKHTWTAKFHIFQALRLWNLAGEEAVSFLLCKYFWEKALTVTEGLLCARHAHKPVMCPI